MKKSYFKKIISISSILTILITCIILSVLPVSAAAQDYILSSKEEYRKGKAYDVEWYYLTPGTAFAHFSQANGDLTVRSDTQPNASFDTDHIYYYNFSSTNPSAINGRVDEIFFNVNIIEPGFTLKPNINYYFQMTLIIPYFLGVNETYNGYNVTWEPNLFTAGGYSWQSVAFSNRQQYNFKLYSPNMLFYNDVMNDPYDGSKYKLPSYPYRVPGSSTNLVYLDIEGLYIRSASNSMQLKSFGIEIPIEGIYNFGGYIGIGGLKVGIPRNYIEYDGTVNPNDYGDFDGSSVDEMLSLETNILRDNAQNLSALYVLFDNFKDYITGRSGFIIGLAGASNIFTRLFGNVPWINSLLTASLALGFVAFVFGTGTSLVGSIINRSARNDSRKFKDKNSKNDR